MYKRMIRDAQNSKEGEVSLMARSVLEGSQTVPSIDQLRLRSWMTTS